MSRRKGFTLVELLVVVGIIAVLISLLLPSLNNARRNARRVQCLSSLKEIGHGFQMYAATFKGAYPMAAWRPSAGATPTAAEQDMWQGWMHQVAPFLSSLQSTGARGDIGTNEALRKNSVLWGCPEWTKVLDYDPGANPISSAEINYTGYGMQFTPTWFDEGAASVAAQTANWAIKTNSVNGKFVKATVWGRKAADRGLIFDATAEVVSGSGSTVRDFNPTTTICSPFTGATLLIDSTRHLKTGSTKQQSYSQRGVNVLYCDGHVDTASILECVVAIRDPGGKPIIP